jgi:hypothetical protein
LLASPLLGGYLKAVLIKGVVGFYVDIVGNHSKFSGGLQKGAVCRTFIGAMD